MKAGSLVKIVDPLQGYANGALMGDRVTGIILSEYEHRTETNGRVWYTVLVEGTPRAFREDYLGTL